MGGDRERAILTAPLLSGPFDQETAPQTPADTPADSQPGSGDDDDFEFEQAMEHDQLSFLRPSSTCLVPSSHGPSHGPSHAPSFADSHALSFAPSLPGLPPVPEAATFWSTTLNVTKVILGAGMMVRGTGWPGRV